MVLRTVHQQRSEMEGKMRKAATRRKVSEHDNTPGSGFSDYGWFGLAPTQIVDLSQDEGIGVFFLPSCNY